jgi:hypothetical protein
MRYPVSTRLCRAAAPGRPKQGPLPSGEWTAYSPAEGLS